MEIRYTKKDAYTTDEAMVIVGISKPTILKYMKNGELAYFGKGGRSGYFIKHNDLINFMDKFNMTSKKIQTTESIELKINLLKQEQIKKIIELAKLKGEDNEKILNLEIALLDLQIKELELKNG